MKNILLLILTLFTTNAFAMLDLDLGVAVTPVEQATYICGDDGGGYAISVELNKVWQVDSKYDVTEGLELNVTNFSIQRCPHCFAIDAETNIFGTKLNHSINLKSKGYGGSNMKVLANTQISATGLDEEFSYECEVLSH